MFLKYPNSLLISNYSFKNRFIFRAFKNIIFPKATKDVAKENET